MAKDQSTQLSERIERDVRALIGDLQMQIIVLRGMLDLAQQPKPEEEPMRAMKTNGAQPRETGL